MVAAKQAHIASLFETKAYWIEFLTDLIGVRQIAEIITKRDRTDAILAVAHHGLLASDGA